MKRIAGIIAALMTVLMLASCSSGKVVYEQMESNRSVTGKTWTVLVYMCGGAEETAFGTYSNKLSELMSVDYPENVKVLVQTGGSDKWHKKGIYSDYVQRFEMGKDTMYLSDQALATNMGNYQTLVDFLSWGTSKYKSDNYMLVMAGEGSGTIHGMCYDELNDDDSLNLEEISYAISLSGIKFDIVSFDTSLMGSLETAVSLYTYADYMVAPQDILGSGDFDYKNVMEYLCNNPSVETEQICKAICNSYYNKCVDNGNAEDAAMSVIDMSKVSTLNQAFDGMAGDMLTATDGLLNYINLSKAMDKVLVYGGATVDEGFSNSIDLGDTAVKINEYVGNTSNVLIEALNDAVVYRVCGDRKQSCTGLSLYYPISQNNDELQSYMEISNSNRYKEFLRKISTECSVTDEMDSSDFHDSWAWVTYDNDMQTLEYKSILDNNVYELNILGNMDVFKSVGINVYKHDTDNDEYVYIGRYNDVYNDWPAGIFKDDFNGQTTRLCGKNVSMRLVRSYDNYEIYSIPVILNGETSNVRVIRDINEDTYNIIGAWGGVNTQTGKVGHDIKKLGFFDRIAPMLSVYDEDKKSIEYIKGSSGLKLFGGVSKKNIANGEYMLEYEMNDVYNAKRYGTPVKGTSNGGKIIFE